MICICDKTQDIRLEESAQQALFALQKEGTPPFSILMSDLLKLVLTQNWKMSLECFQIVAQETKLEARDTNRLVSDFEYTMCETFIMNCVRTTFPDHRQHFMKATRQFFLSLRSTLTKDIKRYTSEDDSEKSQDVVSLVQFLARLIKFCSENLYVDKPLETALPLFEVLKMIQDIFGEYDYHIRVTQILPGLGLLAKEQLM